jgi:dienelactone hydrolase
MRRFARVIVVSGIALLGMGVLLIANTQEPSRDPGSRPLEIEYPSGTFSLRGVVFRPVGPGTHPAVLFLHGSGQDYTREMATIGPLYTRHGYVLFFPFRRGQGLSVGRGEAISESLAREFKAHGAAARMRLMAQLLATEQMDEVLAALKYLQTQPYVDSSRIAVAGNSFGGILAMLSAERAPGIRAVVASAPAAQTWASGAELRERLVASARNARVPVYFFQATNDYDLAPTERLSEEMSVSGKPHVRKIFPAFGTSTAEGHSFGYFGGEVWGADVFAFLQQQMK